MNTQDVNSLLDPEKVPVPARGDAGGRLYGQLQTDSPDLLDSIEGGTVPELVEEPPWLADFLAHYKMVFGNGRGEAPATGRSEPVRMAEAPTASNPIQNNNREAGQLNQNLSNHASGSSKTVEPPRKIFAHAISEGLSWIHIALVMTLVALLVGLIVMFVHPTHRQKGTSGLGAPIASANLPIVQAAAPVPSAVTAANAPSYEQAGPMLLHKVLPVYPRAALAQRLEGNVSVQTEISPDGKVRTVTVLNGDPLLAEAAVEAVRQWIYTPSTIGQPEPRQQEIIIHFKAP